ncbi:hypothetical protein [Streptomyces sp. NK08204]|uniref:hypothetical protein n=1 Tax=Streptomyces sp. NK08204 TaxID=2873260 RepID=UPI001CED5FBA|nr:hypothetical protein [Streptomyces sp. NK08204]
MITTVHLPPAPTRAGPADRVSGLQASGGRYGWLAMSAAWSVITRPGADLGGDEEEPSRVRLRYRAARRRSAGLTPQLE